MEDTRQIYLFLPTIKYALYINEIHDIFNYFSQQLSIPYIYLADKWEIYLFLPQL